MIWTKKGHWSAKFQTFDCSLLGTFCWKYIKFQLNKYRGVRPHDKEDWCKIWRKTNLLFQKWQEFCEFWSDHSKISKTCTLIGPFRAKYIQLDLKKYRGVIFYDTEESCKIWRKTDLENDMRNLPNFHQKTWSVKIEVLLGSFFSKWKMHELKIYRGVMCDETEEWGIWQIFTSMKIVISFYKVKWRN